MVWELTGDVEQFAEVAGEFLRSRPVEHTVLLTVVATLRQQGPRAYGSDAPVFGWWRTGNGVGGALFQTPPRPLMVTAVPAEAVPAAVDVFADRALPGVNMPAEAAEAFAAQWGRRTGAATSVRMRVRLYRLETLIPPATPPAGRARTAGPEDRELLIRWLGEFYELLGEPLNDVAAIVDDRIGHGGVTLWEDGGEPVSMAIRSRPEAGMVRVQSVYTPIGWRGRGYAAGATTAATRAALAEGVDHVVLNTDLANPVSNRLYQRLGYRPVEDRTVVEFS